jgi:hypothetical protein
MLERICYQSGFFFSMNFSQISASRVVLLATMIDLAQLSWEEERSSSLGSG